MGTVVKGGTLSLMVKSGKPLAILLTNAKKLKNFYGVQSSIISPYASWGRRAFAIPADAKGLRNSSK